MGKSSSKESTVQLFKKYVWLVDTINHAGRISFERLNELWCRSMVNNSGNELPRKTFHNHKIAVKEMFDIEILCDKSAGNLYYIQNPENVKGEGVRQWLLNSLSISNAVLESKDLHERILFEQIPSGQQYLTLIIEAMRNNNAIEIEYQSFQDSFSFKVEVDPYCLKVFHLRWYLISFNKYLQDMRTYALDRIKSITVTDQKFVLPIDFDGEVYFKYCFGIINNGSIDTVQIKVRNETNKHKYFKSLPLHPSQMIIEENSVFTIFQYELRPTYDFKQELMSHIPEIEVISPSYLRQEIICMLKEQLELYSQ